MIQGGVRARRNESLSMELKPLTSAASSAGLVALALAALVVPAASAGQVSILEDIGGGLARVRVYDEATGAFVHAPLGLQRIQLLPLEVNGRTDLHAFRPGTARLRSDVPATTRAQLPDEQGSLYHYARPLPDGRRVFGFLQVLTDGSARNVLELPGVGPGGQSDPFVPRLAIAPAGDAFLVITVTAAGGNVLEVGLGDPVQLVDRTSNLPPRRYFPFSLHLANTWGVCIGPRGVMRFDRAAPGGVSLVDFGAATAPTRFSGHAVLSANEQWLAFTAGGAAPGLDVYVCGTNDVARKVTQAPLPITGAGFRPEALDGPHLAVANDGQSCAWRTEDWVLGALVRECWVGRAQAPAPPLHLSADANFLDTADEIGLFAFRPGGKLFVAIGAQQAPGANALENTDLYSVDIPPTLTNVTFTNLSLSSGDATAPFLTPASITIEHPSLLPDGSATWFGDSNGQHGTVSAVVDTQSGSTTLLSNVKTLSALEFVNGWAWIAIRRSDNNNLYETYRAAQDLSTPATLITSLANANYDRFAVRADGNVAYVATQLTSQKLARVQLDTGVVESYSPNPGTYGPNIAITPAGGVAFSELAGGVATFSVWPAGGGNAVVLQSTATSGCVLPGR